MGGRREGGVTVRAEERKRDQDEGGKAKGPTTNLCVCAYVRHRYKPPPLYRR